MKKLVALVMALAMLLTCAAAFAEGTPDFYAKYPQYNVAPKDSGAELEILIVYDSSLFTDFEDWWWWGFMEEVTGVKVVPRLIETNVYNEQIAITLSSDDLPDIIWKGFSNTEIVDYGVRQEAFAPLNDYVLNPEIMPNLNKLFEENPETLLASYCYDGNIYGLPVFALKNSNLSSRPIWDSKYLAKAGIEDYNSIATLDDMYEALKAAVAVDYNENGADDEVGWVIYWGTDGKFGMESIVNYILRAYGFASNNGIYGYDTKSQVGGLSVLLPGYYETLQYLNKLYTEGLIDPDMFSQSETDMVAKMSAGQGVFSTYWNPGYFPAFVELGNDAFWGKTLVWQTPLIASEEYAPIAPVAPKDDANGNVVITKACENKELAAKWLDVCYDALIGQYYLAGPEFHSEDAYGTEHGYTYIYGGYDFHWEDAMAAQGLAGMNEWEYLSRQNAFASKSTSGIADSFYVASEEGLAKYGDFYANMKDWCDNYYEEIAPYHVETWPEVYYTEEQVRTINELTSDVETYIIENTAKFISGEKALTEEAFAEFQAGLEAVGGMELNAVYAEAYATYIANA